MAIPFGEMPQIKPDDSDEGKMESKTEELRDGDEGHNFVNAFNDIANISPQNQFTEVSADSIEDYDDAFTFHNALVEEMLKEGMENFAVATKVEIDGMNVEIWEVVTNIHTEGGIDLPIEPESLLSEEETAALQADTEKMIVEVEPEIEEISTLKKKAEKVLEKDKVEKDEMKDLKGLLSQLFDLIGKLTASAGFAEAVAEAESEEKKDEEMKDEGAIASDGETEQNINKIKEPEQDYEETEETIREETDLEREESFREGTNIEREKARKAIAEARNVQSFLGLFDKLLNTFSTNEMNEILDKQIKSLKQRTNDKYFDGKLLESLITEIYGEEFNQIKQPENKYMFINEFIMQLNEHCMSNEGIDYVIEIERKYINPEEPDIRRRRFKDREYFKKKDRNKAE